MYKTVLVTGATGFLGNHVVRLLKAKGYKVIEFSKTRGFDISSVEQLNKALKGVDAVIHLAAVIEEDASLETLRKVNVDGTKNVLEASVKNKVKRFIHASTIGVYGSFDGIAKEDQSYNPVSDYERTKTEAEKLVLEYQELLPVTVLRPPYVLGANSTWKNAIKTAKKGFPLVGDGKNAFHVTHVEDVASAFVFCLEHDETIGEVYNVSTAKATTQEEMRRRVAKSFGLSEEFKTTPVWLAKTGASVLSFLAKLQGKKAIVNPTNIWRISQNRALDSSKLMALGWKPKYSSEQAIQKTIQELREQKMV